MSTGSPRRREVDPDELLARLRTLTADRGLLVTDLAPLDGGRSSLTYRVLLRSGATSDREVVVRLAPPGLDPVGNRDVLRQARIMAVLAEEGTVPVPPVVLTDAGSLFLMDLLPGDVTEPIFNASGPLPSPSVVRGRALAATRALAALHQVPADRVEEQAVNTPIDELDRWNRTLEAAGGSQRADEVLQALRATVPADGEPAVVHGDFRLGNCLFVDTTLTAVLDWEIWGLGDPRVDLAWLLLTAMPDVHPGADRAPLGMPTADEIVAEYAAHAARPDAVVDVDWFIAASLFKMAAMARHIGKKFDADDPRRTGREAAAERMLTAALGQVEQRTATP
jgi:aminoglycoside phosphotransferase (APT) family kinase protein